MSCSPESSFTRMLLALCLSVQTCCHYIDIYCDYHRAGSPHEDCGLFRGDHWLEASNYFNICCISFEKELSLGDVNVCILVKGSHRSHNNGEVLGFPPTQSWKRPTRKLFISVVWIMLINRICLCDVLGLHYQITSPSGSRRWTQQV